VLELVSFDPTAENISAIANCILDVDFKQPMNLETVFSRTGVLALTFTIVPQQSLKLPRETQTNTLRGAFGNYFRRLVCVPSCHTTELCPLRESCPYKLIFEPSPPLSVHRLSKNQDLPRPFIFRSVGSKRDLSRCQARMAEDELGGTGSCHDNFLVSKSTYQPGEKLQFHVLLIGKAVEYLPYFVLSFREVERSGLGLNRARCQLEEVSADGQLSGSEACPERTGTENEKAHGCQGESVYTLRDQVLHSPRVPTIAEYVHRRERDLWYKTKGSTFLKVHFLSPTSLRFQGREIRNPEFHHLFKRVRDRVNSICTFYGPGSIDTDFKALGNFAERVITAWSSLRWVERTRFSSKCRRRHELSGFIGKCIYDLSDLPSGVCEELLRWLLAGELLHVGKHTVWGNGRFVCMI
jgi:hypothetical protein